MSICQRCGLPEKLCICSELRRTESMKKIVKSLFGKYKDDFSYCELCGCFHYKEMHIKNFK